MNKESNSKQVADTGEWKKIVSDSVKLKSRLSAHVKHDRHRESFISAKQPESFSVIARFELSIHGRRFFRSTITFPSPVTCTAISYQVNFHLLSKHRFVKSYDEKSAR